MPQLQRKHEDGAAIPDRLYFKIGDVARICGLEAYVLRFWESQFPQLKPNKSGTGQRLYRRRDVELALEIKELVHGKGYTLSGARQALGEKQRGMRQPKGLALVPEAEESRGPLAATVERARTELRSLAALLSEPVARPQRRRTRLAAVASGDLFSS